MATNVTITNIEKKDPYTWYFYFEGDPTTVTLFAVTVNGQLMQFSEQTMFQISDPAYEFRPPQVEVRGYGYTTPFQSELYPPYITIQWRGNLVAGYYVVKEYVGSAYVERFRVWEDGRGYYSIQSAPLADATTHEWRVVPIDLDYGEQDPLDIQVFVICNPNFPDVEYTYVAGTHTLTATARA